MFGDLFGSQEARDVLTVIHDSLVDDGHGALVGERYYDVMLIRKGPQAIEGFTDPNNPGVPLLSIVITDPYSLPHSQDAEVSDIVDDFYVVWIYGPDTSTGWQQVGFLRTYIRQLLRDAEFKFTNGTFGFFRWVGGMQVRRNHEEFQGSINANVRFSATYIEQRIVGHAS